MKTKITILFFLVYLTVHFSGFAQSDYRAGFILTLQNDTIQGFVKYQNKLASKSFCLFKATESSKPTTYTPKQINGYGYKNGKYFASSLSVDYNLYEPVFMEYLLGGRIDLYFYREKEKQGEYYVAIKDTIILALNNALDTVFLNDQRNLRIKGFINRHRYRGQLRALMSDQLDMIPEVDKVTYDLKSLTNLVLQYNARYSGSKTMAEEKPKAFRVRMGVMASTGSTYLFLSEFSYQHNHYGMGDADFQDNSTFTFGALINVQMLELHEKISFQAEPSISMMHYGSDVTRKSGASNETHSTIDLDITAFKLPLSVKYSFYASKWKSIPFARIGLAHQRFLQATSNMKYNVSESTSSKSGSYADFQYSEYQNSVFLAGGVDFRLRKNSVSAEMILEVGDGIFVTKYQPFMVHSWTRNLSFQLSYSL